MVANRIPQEALAVLCSPALASGRVLAHKSLRSIGVRLEAFAKNWAIRWRLTARRAMGTIAILRTIATLPSFRSRFFCAMGTISILQSFLSRLFFCSSHRRGSGRIGFERVPISLPSPVESLLQPREAPLGRDVGDRPVRALRAVSQLSAILSHTLEHVGEHDLRLDAELTGSGSVEQNDRGEQFMNPVELGEGFRPVRAFVVAARDAHARARTHRHAQIDRGRRITHL